MIVITFHIDQFLRLFGLEAIGYSKTLVAGYGVILFFVLSGFLITYLLLLEKQKFKKVELGKFYLRRILRIWPIYYLVIILTIFLIVIKVINPANSHIGGTIFLYSFFLPNLGYAYGLDFITITPLWSVGVEEQFYAFWPLLLNKSKNILNSLFAIFLIYMCIKVIYRIFDDTGSMYWLIRITSFDSMAIGGIMAYYLFKKSKIILVFYHPFIQVISWLFFIISVLYKPIHIATLFDNEIHSFFYAIIIVNVSTNPKSLINLENSLLNFLGRISYGIYVYHMIIIYLLSYFLKDIIQHIKIPFIEYLVVYFLIYFFTILVAFISYKYFESKFLLLKLKYSKIKSTN